MVRDEPTVAIGADVYDEAELYAAAFDWPLDAEVDWLLRESGEVKSVLEPFCGNARYGPVFAVRGVRYWGLDRSSTMLQRALVDDNVRVQQGDAREFAIHDGPPGGFDLAWCPVNSVRHLLEEREVLAHLQCVRRHLRAAGRYVIELDLFSPGHSITVAPHRSTWSIDRADGSTVHASWLRESADAQHMRCTERAAFRLVRDGRIVKELSHVYAMRLWTVNDVVRLAAMGGFEVQRVHRSEASAGWPRVELSSELDSTDWNYLFFLRAVERR